jgi:hypothetical protein
MPPAAISRPQPVLISLRAAAICTEKCIAVECYCVSYEDMCKDNTGILWKVAVNCGPEPVVTAATHNILLHILAVCLCLTSEMLHRDSVFVSNNFSCYTCRKECMCCCCVLHACLKYCGCYMFWCYFIFLRLSLMNIIFYPPPPHTHYDKYAPHTLSFHC